MILRKRLRRWHKHLNIEFISLLSMDSQIDWFADGNRQVHVEIYVFISRDYLHI